MSAPSIRRGRTGSRSLQTQLDDLDTIDNGGNVAAFPAASTMTGRIMYCSNGASGSPCLAYSNGTNWLRITLGAAISAT